MEYQPNRTQGPLHRSTSNVKQSFMSNKGKYSYDYDTRTVTTLRLYCIRQTQDHHSRNWPSAIEKAFR